MSKTRDRILDKLRELGVEDLEVSYEGYEDSGSVESFDVRPEGIDLNVPTGVFHEQALWAKGKVVYTEVEFSLADYIADYVYDTLENELPGWELNEGSSGVVRFKPKTGEIQIDHNKNFTMSRSLRIRGL